MMCSLIFLGRFQRKGMCIANPSGSVPPPEGIQSVKNLVEFAPQAMRPTWFPLAA